MRFALRHLFMQELNEIYLSMFILHFAESLISIFVPIYLYTLGYPIPFIIAYFAVHEFAYLLLCIPMTKVIARIGAKHAMLLSMPLLILYYLGLRGIESAIGLTLLLPLLLALHGSLFNISYHLNYLYHSRAKHRGTEIGTIGILTTTSTALAPLVGGTVATTLGFGPLFAGAAVLLLFSTAPLFLTKDRRERHDLSTRDVLHVYNTPSLRSFWWSQIGYSIETIIGRVLWPIFLIILLSTTARVGALVTLSLMMSIVAFYIIGKLTDKHRMGLIRMGTILHSIGWLGRLLVASPISLFIIDSYKNIAEKIVTVSWAARSYDHAERHHFAIVVGREMIFRIPRLILFPVLMLLFTFDLPAFPISIILASAASLLYMVIK